MLVYEKGVHIGSDNKAWVRWELRVYSTGFDIPFTVLINPGPYFQNSYPVTMSMPINIGEYDPSAYFACRKKSSTASLLNILFSMRNSYGRYFAYLRERGVPYRMIFNAIARPGGPPERLLLEQGERQMTRAEVRELVAEMLQVLSNE